MRFETLSGEFAVCQIPSPGHADFSREFVFVAKTDEEISLVCEAAHVPAAATAVQPGWRALRVAGALDFALVGVLAGISKALADEGISLFCVSTYNTDYVLVPKADFARARAALAAAGHEMG